MNDEPEPKPAAEPNLNELLDRARSVLADETSTEDCRQLAREILRRADVANT
jgi:hypothetical protein